MMVSVWPMLLMAAAAPGGMEPLSADAYRALEREVIRDWRTLALNPRAGVEMSTALRDKVRRLHATSPSFASLSLFASAGGESYLESGSDSAIAFGADFTSMTREMSRDFGRDPALPAFDGLDFANSDVRGGRAPGKSLFQHAFEVTGWSTGMMPPDAPLRGSSVGDVRHLSHFDGASLAVLAPVYELAKHLRREVSVEFSGRAVRDLDQDRPLHDVDSALLTAEIPAFAITQDGLIAGTFRSAGFFGGACASGQPTAAEFSFPKRIEAVTLAVIATGLSFDPARAKVRVDSQTWPDVSGTEGYDVHALATRVMYTVDLDGDGVPELRGVSRVETEIDYELLTRRSASPPIEPAVRFIPVAGWYANNYNFLDANIAGRWLRLSSYAVVTCT